jgi:hypothetical protein
MATVYKEETALTLLHLSEVNKWVDLKFWRLGGACNWKSTIGE